ncbi:MAG: hypothetical protein A2931_02975 [Candidatus Niyogibacteria bacterium RIFCSPLOWO2_01_FULL_45_48]|uniref:Capsule polysaccharide biosynthesis protein n=2 Tax=Parcubacteria group TaxID=1794811 RepID=A0A1G2EW59_9BACT|nr:MAG: hypothetical protein A3B93_00095 [Candidatus Nomurabacteria bacterium RIFCSPHIGHO2_02_FULL_42_24]OGZ29426.1 MAG: hypothetical protein A2835_03305 [Candidatus Niyogibacteria bacterium RIFCSPHIGHO2_01_FULL_45_28]OGZ30035.1 MAG: hypothetical protein A2931_02975 [Candidatus Niyogibacteria bacterium RIFCSPLOWO2_01_FULL_45_48]
MRLFLIWTGMDLARELIPRLRAQSHEVAYWVGLKGGGEEKFPEVIFHDHYDAWDGKPAPALASEKFDPPSADLIGRFHKTESLILTMMNKHFDWMGSDERKHLYYHMLSYWSGALKKLKPDAVIFSYIPHTVYDYLLFELARSENIKTVMLQNTMPITGRMLIYDDFREGSAELKNQMEKNKNRKFSPEDLTGNTREFYESRIKTGQDAAPQYLKESRKRFSFFNRVLLKSNAVFTSFKNGDFAERMFTRAIKLLKENIREEYNRVSTEPDFSQKYIYAPLHYQPECTSSPLGDVFVDQILMIKTLSASLPEGWIIYVKEHPSQWFKRGLNYGSVRYRGYYDQLSRIQNVRLVPVTADSHLLTQSAKAVATISGVAGSEAILRGKPAVVFGYPWYRDCRGVFKVDGADACRDALKKIENGFSVNGQSVINFLKSVDEVGIRAYIDMYGQRTSGVNEDESVSNISGAILKSLEKN